MKLLLCCLFFSVSVLFAQETPQLKLQDSISLKATKFVGVDAYQSLYYLKANVIFKQEKGKIYSYQDTTLGAVTLLDILNPLAIIVFYKDYNTVVYLDNHLSEIKRVSFNNNPDFATINWVGTCSNHRLWRFNTDQLQLEVYNDRTQQIKVNSSPITDKIIQIISNYNYCWLLTSSKIVTYNIYGSLINSFDVSEFDNFWQQDDYFILRKDNQLFLLNKSSKTIEKIKLPKIKIKDVFVKAETVYIYNGIKLYTLNFKN